MLKRFITILTVVALLCSVLSLGFTATAYYQEEIIYGDVDGLENEDGEYDVDTEDALLALRIASGVELLEDEEQLKRADVNFDGAVTVFDARQILRGAAGLATLQPSGAFTGFDGGGVFGNEETLVVYFNSRLNQIKVTESEEKQYVAATITKTESDNLTHFNIKEIELPVLGNASAEGIASMVEESLTEDDKENESMIIPFGSDDFSLVSVEGEGYVSDLSASDIFGSRAVYDAELGQLTIEIALPDTEVEMSTQSAYAKVLNTSELIAEQNTTLMKLMQASSGGETAMLREFKNCVLKIDVDVATNNVLSYTVSYQSKVYVAQTNFGIGSLSAAKLKGIEFEKDHLVKYEDFQWPSVQTVQ